jgi:KaiC/GvpD/RAD55 family RecA-like ATPase
MADFAKAVVNALKADSIIILSLQSKEYREDQKASVHLAAGTFKKTCYITLNDPYESIVGKASAEDIRKIFFIDCVTSTIKKPSPAKNVVFVSSPRSLTEISIALKKIIYGEKTDAVVFDSISALMVYEQQLPSLKFIHSLVLTLREGKQKALLIILKEDAKDELMKDLTMFVDRIVEAG